MLKCTSWPKYMKLHQTIRLLISSHHVRVLHVHAAFMRHFSFNCVILSYEVWSGVGHSTPWRGRRKTDDSNRGDCPSHFCHSAEGDCWPQQLSHEDLLSAEHCILLDFRVSQCTRCLRGYQSQWWSPSPWSSFLHCSLGKGLMRIG